MRTTTKILLLAAGVLLLIAFTIFEAAVTSADAQRFVQGGAASPSADPVITLPFPGEEY